ncbi:uncharacterized protein LOC143875694 [Tasmannia lanceolata]|uniref:uncharacterized protein LOC143875694 n=1 Tax=Tasmannia lanceolata TaxID=3420 RepID=UPI0040630FFB
MERKNLIGCSDPLAGLSLSLFSLPQADFPSVRRVLSPSCWSLPLQPCCSSEIVSGIHPHFDLILYNSSTGLFGRFILKHLHQAMGGKTPTCLCSNGYMTLKLSED